MDKELVARELATAAREMVGGDKTVKKLKDGDYSGSVEEFDGPGIKLYKALVTVEGKKYATKKQWKTQKEAEKVLKSTLKALASDTAGGVDLTKGWKVASDRTAARPRDHAYAGDYATLIFDKRKVSFTISTVDDQKTGSQPYGNDPIKNIRVVLDIIERSGIDGNDVEVI